MQVKTLSKAFAMLYQKDKMKWQNNNNKKIYFLNYFLVNLMKSVK